MRASSALCGLKAAMMERYAFAAKCFNKHEQRRIVMKILVMGAGAVGNYFGARLQQAGEDVIFCARGENLSVLCERSEEHTSELQSHVNLVCRLLLEKKKNIL